MQKRVDILLSEHGFCRSRSEAKDLIERGVVEVNGEIIKKVSKTFEEGIFLELKNAGKIIINIDQYVSRGAYKLLHALEFFDLRDQIKNKVCLDIGSSTGGFTQVLLESGAKIVYSVDVGSAQFDKKLLENEEYKDRVILKENTDIRSLENLIADFVVCDVSFISIKEIINVLPKFINQSTKIILLIKPQFEVGKNILKKNSDGVVKDKNAVEEILSDVRDYIKQNNFKLEGQTESPIKGGSGNVEYLFYLSVPV